MQRLDMYQTMTMVSGLVRVAFGLLLLTVQSVTARAAMVAEWHFDGNYADSSGLGNHLTPSGGPTFVGPVAPFGGQAVNMVHTSSQFAQNTAPSSMNFTTAYSISGWVKAPLPGAGNFRPLFWRGAGTVADIEVYLQTTTNDLVVAHNRNATPSSAFDFTAVVDPPNDIAYHLAVTYDGTNVNMYFDGVLQTPTQGWNGVTTIVSSAPANRVMNVPLVSVGYNVRVGSAPDLSGFFTGSLDEMRLFNTVLTQQEIDNLFEFNNINGAPVPEPSTLALLGLGAVGLAIKARRRRVAG